MTAPRTQPPLAPSTSGLVRTTSRPISLPELATLGGIVAALLLILLYDLLTFPSQPSAVSATILGAEAEAGVAVAIGIEVWFHFLDRRAPPHAVLTPVAVTSPAGPPPASPPTPNPISPQSSTPSRDNPPARNGPVGREVPLPEAPNDRRHQP